MPDSEVFAGVTVRPPVAGFKKSFGVSEVSSVGGGVERGKGGLGAEPRREVVALRSYKVR